MDPNDAYNRGLEFGKHLQPREEPQAGPRPANPLEDYFERHTTGPGLWKWRHYFDIYHRHFAKFVGREVHVVEIGVYSGGSLGMWRHYFGPACHIYGVDIQPECRAYEDDTTRIFIGDQGDPAFWRDFVQQVPAVDVVIDDGSHRSDDQIVTLEALLPHIRPGGVYLCEDVFRPRNLFHDYVNGLSRNLYWRRPVGPPGDERYPTEFQRTVSVHLYPFLAVIERRSSPLNELRGAKRGTEWQRFLDRGRG
jgi:methyltransferase family protein